MWNFKFTLKDVSTDLRIAQLKRMLELMIGIPADIMKLRYLDAGDINDDYTLVKIEIVNFSTLQIKVLAEWERLLTCVYKRDFDALMNTGINPLNTDDKIDDGLQKALLIKKRSTCLFLAANIGIGEFLKKLLDAGFDVNARLESGCMALHTAVACGRYACIDLLLERGALYDMKNEIGEFCLQLANEYGHKLSERHLSLFEWKLRAQGTKRIYPEARDLMMHQQFDSGNPTWFKGKFGATYLCSTVKEKEFSGTAISAPRIGSPRVKPDTLVADLGMRRPKSSREALAIDHKGPSSSRYVNPRYSIYDPLKFGLAGFSEASRLEDEHKKLQRRLDYKAPLPSVTACSQGARTCVKKSKRHTMYTDFDRLPEYQLSAVCSYLMNRPVSAFHSCEEI